MKNECVVVILSYNSAGIIGETLGQALMASTNVLLVDSGSTDATCDIARKLGCTVLHRPFSNYSDQRNWAIKQVTDEYEWQLHLDADEVLDNLAIEEIRMAVVTGKHSAYMLRRRDYFMGRELKHSGVNPWHLRLFRSGVGHCENRLYDQHFFSNEPAAKLRGWMHDKNALTLTEWTARHNRWSDLESKECNTEKEAKSDILQAKAFGDPRERVRFIKHIYYKMPGGIRAIAYFLYRYLVRLGFLDGKEGLYFAFFQALWFRMLVDAKIYERQQTKDVVT